MVRVSRPGPKIQLPSDLRSLNPDEKYCSHCQQIKLKTDFYRQSNGKNSYLTECKECNIKRIALKSTFYQYGITYEEYKTMWQEQNGKCAICGCEETSTRNGKVKRLAVDHCHTTGAIRGLLCADCNVALGYIHEDPERTKALLKYIEERCLW